MICEVRYNCLTSAQLVSLGFLLDANAFPPPNPTTQRGFYNQQCTFNANTLETVCTSRNSATSGTTSVSQCAFDTGFALPPRPSLQDNICRNVVLSVNYRFRWSAGTITAVTSTVQMGNIDVTAPVAVKQNFEYQFTDQEADIPGPVPTSGKYGYDAQAPVLLGNVITNNNVFSNVQPVTSSGLLLPG
ncbi:1-acylglycerol-3-phosphate O-acyltransferase 6 (lysophosphatidic acid acyltransferase, zeta) [Cichlidogyrus casuarinus]|uniref:1-acylglycerol-3-phosphate O-acyltransferase 6 (Lysophosphatidic acid acyltransferase, zeta) n=1 Tax=Cichlidogyrus casuarinus TaxID=1844966 RepID=A0ABD2PN00_9PLAT